MTPAFASQLAGRIEASGVVAVLIIDRVEDAVPLAKSLLAGGITAMELTLRTPAALDALREVVREVPEILAGVGTILSPAQVTQVVDAGAAFGVAPGTNPRVLAAAREAGLSFAPGITTPTDIEIAVENDCRVLKFFPAEPMGGLKYLKAISAPYAHFGLKYIPLGGVNEDNMTAYLSDPLISALGGSWLAPKDLIKAGNWDAITTLAQNASAKVSAARAK
ncbi:MAG: bifunctional 4-hydroxy-2-oxoglutarate aldolase/2-dehydro-3-deoxy-phosphogluconate aldolase [Chthoniobacterales bacterium]